MQPTVVIPATGPHFTIMDTQTEGERALREEVRKLSGEIQRLTNIMVGMAQVLEEHGISIFDPESDDRAHEGDEK